MITVSIFYVHFNLEEETWVFYYLKQQQQIQCQV